MRILLCLLLLGCSQWGWAQVNSNLFDIQQKDFVVANQGNDDQYSTGDVYFQYIIRRIKAPGAESSALVPERELEENLNRIEYLYAVDGCYAGALYLLIGETAQDITDPLRPFAFSSNLEANMQDIIARLPPGSQRETWQARLYHMLSEIYFDIGNGSKAIAYQEKAADLLGKAKPVDNNKLVNALLVLTGEYLLLHQQKQAKDVFFKAAAIYSAMDTGAGLYPGFVYTQALMEQEQGQVEQAAGNYKKAIRWLAGHQLSSQPLFFKATLHLSQCYQSARQYEKADSLLLQAVRSAYSLHYHAVALQQLLLSLCTNDLLWGKWDKLTQHLKQATNWIWFETFRNSEGFSGDDLMRYADRLDGWIDLYSTLLYKQKMPAGDVMFDALFHVLQRKNLVFQNKAYLQQLTRSYRSTNIPLPYADLFSTKELCNRQYAYPFAWRKISTDSLEERGTNLERKISLNGFGLAPDDKAKNDVMTTLTASNALNIEFIRYHNLENANDKDRVMYGAFVFGQSLMSGHFVTLCSEAELLKRMQDEEGNFINENQLVRLLYSSSGNTALQLYQLVWAPLEAYLHNAAVINYSPAGVLNNIAFNAIWDGNRYLVNRYTMHLFSSLTEASAYNEKYSMPNTMQVWGNIAYGPVPLTNGRVDADPAAMADSSHLLQSKGVGTQAFKSITSHEPNALSSLEQQYPVQIHLVEGLEATEDNFKKNVEKVSGILHITTHGFYAPFAMQKQYDSLPGNFIAAIPNPGARCGLAFAGVNHYWQQGVPEAGKEDGILTAAEIEQLDLHGIQLVTLSACETGLGDVTAYEGDLGLHRAFKLAGVRYVLASLWSVNARQTAALLTLFYTNWLKGQPPCEALQQAQTTLQKDNPPFEWAGFVLIE